MPTRWGKPKLEEEIPEEKEVDAYKIASPWAHAREMEAEDYRQGSIAGHEGRINLQEMADDEWYRLIMNKMGMFFDDNQMRDAGGQEAFKSFPDFLFQNDDGKAIWDEHQRRLAADPNYLQSTQINDEEMVNNPVVQE